MRLAGCLLVLILLPTSGLVHETYFDRSGLPDLEAFLRFDPPTTGEVRDAQGNVLIELARGYRRVVSYDEVPPILRQAILAAEDKNFLSHSGVDYSALPRVVRTTVVSSVTRWWSGGTGFRLVFPQGGSTLTQQLVRGFFLQHLTRLENGDVLCSDGLTPRILAALVGVPATNRLGPAPQFPRGIERKIDGYLAMRALDALPEQPPLPATTTAPRRGRSSRSSCRVPADQAKRHAPRSASAHRHPACPEMQYLGMGRPFSEGRLMPIQYRASNLCVRTSLGVAALVTVLAFPLATHADGRGKGRDDDRDRRVHHEQGPFADALRLVGEGRQIFRYDTFGNEVFWGETLHLHEAIANVSPAAALAVGLKVDVEALPRKLRRQLRRGEVDLEDPATTRALLELDAIVGVKGAFDEQGRLTSLGTRCALCHSTVDDSLLPGVGRRLDGWANRDLDVGAIINLAPDLSVFTTLLGVDEGTVRSVLESWGPGKFDASLLLDGKAFAPNGRSGAVLIPPAFGLAGVNLHTWTGWGSVSHWNALVANLEMGGQGTFIDRRLDDADRFPIAAREGFGEVRRDPDLVTSKLAALHLYQLALLAPAPPRGSFDAEAAERGRVVFEGRAQCAACHVPDLYTEPGYNLHTPEEIGIDAFQAERSPTAGYRTAPLKGLWSHGKGGYFHDGRFATLREVVDHYDGRFHLGLSDGEKGELIEFLKSL